MLAEILGIIIVYNVRLFFGFRYCENKYSQELDDAVKALIKGVVYLQDRAHAADPIKARAKQRHVAGLREVKKYLLLKKIKMVILAPDLESQGRSCENLKAALGREFEFRSRRKKFFPLS